LTMVKWFQFMIAFLFPVDDWLERNSGKNMPACLNAACFTSGIVRSKLIQGVLQMPCQWSDAL